MENGDRGSNPPIPLAGAKPFLAGADQGLEGKAELVATTGERI